MKNFDPQEAIEWLRETGDEFHKLAEAFEQGVKKLGYMKGRFGASDNGPAGIPSGENKTPTIADIRSAMNGKNARPVTLAKSLGVSKKLIIPLLTPENGFEQFGKGWIRDTRSEKSKD